MPVTLAQFKVGMRDHIEQDIIETIQRTSVFMDRLTFDDAVTASGNGSTLTYGYQVLKTAVAGQGREVNQEYTAHEAEREEKSTNLKIMGAAYEIDRVLAANSDAAIDEVDFQNKQATKGATGRFQYLAINGDSTVAEGGKYLQFDGLSKLLTGTSNEIGATTIDISGTMTQAKAEAFCEGLDDLLGSLDSTDNVVLLCNGKVQTKLVAAARMLNVLDTLKDEFGRKINTYGGTPILDLKEYYNGTANVEVIPITASGSDKVTDIYAVRLGLDGFHAVSPKGGVGLNVILPDFSNAGAVKKGEVELVGSVVLKNTKAAGVLRNVKVA